MAIKAVLTKNRLNRGKIGRLGGRKAGDFSQGERKAGAETKCVSKNAPGEGTGPASDGVFLGFLQGACLHGSS